VVNDLTFAFPYSISVLTTLNQSGTINLSPRTLLILLLGVLSLVVGGLYLYSNLGTGIISFVGGGGSLRIDVGLIDNLNEGLGEILLGLGLIDGLTGLGLTLGDTLGLLGITLGEMLLVGLGEGLLKGLNEIEGKTETLGLGGGLTGLGET